MNNLRMAMLEKVGVPVEQFGDATGRVTLEPLSGCSRPRSNGAAVVIRARWRGAGVRSGGYETLRRSQIAAVGHAAKSE